MKYTVKRCKAALGACNALIVCSTGANKRHWEDTERLWKARLKEALKEVYGS